MTGIENLAVQQSADKKLYVGMTREEAYKKFSKEDYALFDFADQNNNDTISEAEIRRYDGPLLAVEKDDKTKQRFVGHYAGFGGFGNVAGDVITSKEFEFYPGQKFDEINEKDFNLAFRDLDLDSNGELSKEEIQKYQAYVERKNEFNKTIEDNQWNKEENTIKSIIGGIAGAIVGGIGGLHTVEAITDKTWEYLRVCKKFRGDGWRYDQIDWDKVPKTLSKLAHGKFNWPIGLAVTAVGIGAGLLIAQKLWHKKQEPLDKFDDLKQLDEQYQNVYNT